MTTININNFGGELPRVSARALPTGASQINSNLLATSTEFRPLLDDAVVGTAQLGAKTLHRLNRNSSGVLHTLDAQGWIAEVADRNYVKGQINDDATERTFVTFNDGSSAPVAIDATGAYRVLGVPRPSGVVASINAVDEFSVEDAIGADTTQVAAISEAIKLSMVESKLGNGIEMAFPNSTTVGWLIHGTAVTGTLPSTDPGQANFCIPVVETPINVPILIPGMSTPLVIPGVGARIVEEFSFLRSGNYGGNQIVYGSQTYLAVAIDLAASVWLPDGPTLTNKLSALKRPDQPLESLLDSAEVTSVVSSCLDYWSIAKNPLKSVLDASIAESFRLRDVIDSLRAPLAYSTEAYTAAYATFIGPNYAAAGPGVDRIFKSAEWFATTTPGAVVGTSSRYYRTNADSATARTNLLADVATCISPDATGFLKFDFAKLQDYLNKDFLLLINQDITDAEAHKARLSAQVDYCLQPYRDFFSTANLSSFGTGRKTDADRAMAFDSAIAAMDSANAALAAVGARLYGETLQAASNAYNLGARARIGSAAVVRLEEDRFYVITHVNDWGEESAPCDPSERVNLDQSDSVTVTRPSPPSGRNLSFWRIYRSNSGSTAAGFQFVDEVGIATPAYTDTKKSSELQEACPTIGPDGITYWLEPPTRMSSTGAMSSKANPHLRGLTGMPNGVMAGFVDNFVAFCEPYAPYAWPINYQIPLKYDVVGLGAFGQSLFVGTRANPSIISGADSASMSEQMLDDAQACLSARSIVSAGSGVLYASPDGICFANSGGVEVVTTALFAREDWARLDPKSIFAVMHEGVYYFWYSGNGGGCYALDTIAKKLSRVDMPATAVFSDSLTDAIFYTVGTSLKRAFSTGRRTGVWQSGKLELDAQSPLSWGKVVGDQTVENPITVIWSGDGVGRFNKTVTDTQPWRLPSGRYLEHEVYVSGKARVTKVILAGSTDELKGAA